MFLIDGATLPDMFWEFDSDDIPYHSGACDDTIAWFYAEHKEAIQTVPIENARKVLKTTGAWSEEEIITMSDDDVYKTLLWIAAGNAMDDEDTVGHVSTY